MANNIKEVLTKPMPRNLSAQAMLFGVGGGLELAAHAGVDGLNLLGLAGLHRAGLDTSLRELGDVCQ